MGSRLSMLNGKTTATARDDVDDDEGDDDGDDDHD